MSLPLPAFNLILNVDLHGNAYPEKVNTLYANALLLPALAKPVVGCLSDVLQKWKCGRRRLLVAVFALWCGAIILAARSTTLNMYFVGFMSVSLAAAAAESILDGASVELMRSLDLSGAEVQSTAYGMRMAGSLAASLVSPVTVLLLPSHSAAASACIVVPLAGIASAVFTSWPQRCAAEERPHLSSITAGQSGPWCARWWPLTAASAAPALFLFVRSTVPSENDTWFSFMSTKVTGVWFSIAMMGSNLGGILGLLAFQALPKRFVKQIIPTILLTTTLSVVIGALVRCFLVDADVNAPWAFALAHLLVAAVDTAAFLPSLALCAQCASKEYAAAGFAAMALVLDMGDQFSARLSGFLTEDWLIGSGQGRSWGNLDRLVLSCRVGLLVVVPLCPLLRGLDAAEQESDRGSGDVERERDTGPLRVSLAEG
ncbi:unnamed protein product [Polarella glacialis]|uniref:Uncharacterized protein n=3 Tax=Polarella glacialis TaxID=89957 RepID=A0A813F319_POLGL|nr:unnamed protein product [Polarella glacialis]